MSTTIAELFTQLKSDSWREKTGFSVDIEDAHQVLFSPSLTDANAVEVVGNWLQKNQPCVFGRIAAKFGFVSFCILTEKDLLLSDEDIYEKIKAARFKFIRDGFEGKKSNFIVLVVSPKISYAEPNGVVANLAQRLCSLYLEKDLAFDTVYHEEVFLEKPGSSRMTWKWLAGVNYFCAQADRRWWHDHRIPGGMGFSINSVGHLVKSEIIARAMDRLNVELDAGNEEGWKDSKVDSLEKALALAMRTISQAADTVSGKATELLTLREEDHNLPNCPTVLPHSLSDKNHCSYVGYYHTDYTLPSEYFLPNIARPTDIQPFVLDFTYLFHKHVNNPDYWTMGAGRRIRDDAISQQDGDPDWDQYKLMRRKAETVPSDTSVLLCRALDAAS